MPWPGAKRWRLSLFWQLFAALWLSMVLGLFGVLGYFVWRDGRMPPPGPPAPPGPPHEVPAEPLVSGALASLLVSALLARYLSHPIRQLRWALGEVAHERFDTRVRPLMGRRHDELAELASEVDAMTARLQQLHQSRQQLMHHLSHELRSPLHRMQAAVGLARQDPERVAAMLTRIERETERMDALIGELLTLHRLEALHPRGRPASAQTLDISALLQAVADDALVEAEARRQHIALGELPRWHACVDGELICCALDNVLRNALKFSPDGATVHLSAQVDAATGAWVCQIADEGPGVPPHLREAIFEPFTRAPGGQHLPGTGLGLAIARRVLSWHGGHISAQGRVGGGLCVCIVLPALTFPDVA